MFKEAFIQIKTFTEHHRRKKTLVTRLIIVLCVIKSVVCDHRQMQLVKTTGANCKTLPLGDPWASVSSIACYLTCLLRYPETCQSIVYNEDTQSCTPGSTAFGPIDTLSSTIPDASSNDVIMYLKQTVPACNIPGFNIYDVCGTSACLYLSTYNLNHTDAVGVCAGTNSTLFSADTEARFALFWYTSLLHMSVDTWLGLDDIVSESQFKWANGNPLSSWQSSYIWVPPDQPDNYNDIEDCCEASHSSWPGKFGINDLGCSKIIYFICEQ